MSAAGHGCINGSRRHRRLDSSIWHAAGSHHLMLCDPFVSVTMAKTKMCNTHDPSGPIKPPCASCSGRRPGAVRPAEACGAAAVPRQRSSYYVLLNTSHNACRQPWMHAGEGGDASTALLWAAQRGPPWQLHSRDGVECSPRSLVAATRSRPQVYRLHTDNKHGAQGGSWLNCPLLSRVALRYGGRGGASNCCSEPNHRPRSTISAPKRAEAA